MLEFRGLSLNKSFEKGFYLITFLISYFKKSIKKFNYYRLVNI